MDQNKSLGQLYDVQIRIKIFYKQSGWTYSFSTTNAALEICEASIGLKLNPNLV
jgi:hypothetical protein